MAQLTHLSPRDLPVPALSKCKEIGKYTQRHVSDPSPLNEVAIRVEVMVCGDLDEIPRHMRPTRKEDLRSRISRCGRRCRSLEGADTHVNDTFGHESPASERKVKCLDGAITGKEVAGADVRVPREGMEALGE